MNSSYYGYWEYWNLYHKVTFDGEDRLIYINPGVDNIDITRDLYSASKEWMSIMDYGKYEPPIRVIGGDPTVEGDSAGAIYFMTNGWRIYIDDKVDIFGSIYSDDYDSPYLTGEIANLVFSQVSNLVDRIAVESTADSAELVSNKVWSEVLADKFSEDAAGSLVSSYDDKLDNIKDDTSKLDSIKNDTEKLYFIEDEIKKLDSIKDDTSKLDKIKEKTEMLPDGIERGKPISNFSVVLIDSNDHISPKPGLSDITGKVSKDGKGFGLLTNTIYEVGEGIYKVDLTADEMDAEVLVLKFDASGADTRVISFITSS